MSRRRGSSSHSHSQEEDTSMPPAAASSFSAAAAAASSSAAASSTAAAIAARASSSNPLENLLKDLACCICLSVVRKSVSLPCHHFFCSTCLDQVIETQTKQIEEKRKAKSNASLKVMLYCPQCREEYNRRNIVEDPVIHQMSKLCLELRKQPDVKELLSTDDSIFDMSQQSPNASPMQPRRMGSLTNTLSSLIPADHTLQTHHSSNNKKNQGRSTGPKKKLQLPSTSTTPITPIDVFAFSASNSQTSEIEAKSSSKTAVDTKSSKPSHSAPPASDASSTPSRSSARPARQAALKQKSYKEMETQQMDDELSELEVQDDEDEDDDEEEGGDEDMANDTNELEDAAATTSSSNHPTTPVSRRAKASSPLSATSSAAAAAPSSDARKKKKYPFVDLPSEACAVCGGVTEEEEVVKCKLCKVQVHAQLCYGSTVHTLTAEERKNWHCDRCSPRMGIKQVSCCLCPNTDDQAFKKTDKGDWIHASCAFWMPTTRYRDPTLRDAVVDVHLVPKDRWSVQCKFCTGKGAILQCSFPKPKCGFSYHVPCGVRHGILFELRGPGASQMEMSQEDDCDDVFFHSYCFKHQPQAHLVPSCNSAKAKRKRQQSKRKKMQQKKKKESHKEDELEDDDEEEEDAKQDEKNSDNESESEMPARKKTRLSVNRSINLADTSMDTDGDATPSRAGSDFNFRSLISPPSNSPVTTPGTNAHATRGAMAAAAAATSNDTSSAPTAIVSRKLAFTPPSFRTEMSTVLPEKRPSPLRPTLPPNTDMQQMMRSSSEGSMSTSVAPALASKPSLMRPLSLKQQTIVPIVNPVPSRSGSIVAAAALSSLAGNASTGSHSLRAPLRSMAKEEVTNRDSNVSSRQNISSSQIAHGSAAAGSALAGSASNSRAASPALSASHPLSSTAAAPKSRQLARRNIVLLGTKLDSEQQALLEEMAAVLNEEFTRTDKNSNGEKFAFVTHKFDETVTHVITTTTQSESFILQGRTMKYFQGLLGGCWVLGVDWVTASLCARKAVSESDYLVRGDAKFHGGEMIDGARRARHARTALNSEKLFHSMHFVWNGGQARSKASTKEDVARLISMASGEFRDSFPGREKSNVSSQGDDSDLEGEDGGNEETQDMDRSSPHRRAGGAGAVSQLEKGKWFLLVDDTAVKRRNTSSSVSQLKELKEHVAPASWDFCSKNNVSIVGVNWLFDCISAYSIQPTAKVMTGASR